MKAYLIVPFLATLAFGCSAAVDSTTGVSPGFLPTDRVADAAFENASARFVAPSGIRPFIAPDGVPVRTAPQTEGSDTCGETHIMSDARTGELVDMFVVVWSPAPGGCSQNLADTLTHEMIHVMRRLAGLDRGSADMGHAASGVFAAKAGDMRFDAPSLDALCEAVPCPAFNPE
jgi:hypothetical protein